MDEATKKEARIEIKKRLDALLFERAHFWWVRYHTDKLLKDTEVKLSEAKAAASFFNLKISYPILQETERFAGANASQVYDMADLKAFMDKATDSDWFPAGCDSVESMKEHLNDTLAFANIEGIPTDQEISTSDDNSKITISEIAITLLRQAGDEGLKAANIREYIENNYKRKLHDKTVGMTLYRLSERDLVRRSGHTWFYVPPKAETENPGGGTPGLLGLPRI